MFEDDEIDEWKIDHDNTLEFIEAIECHNMVTEEEVHDIIDKIDKNTAKSSTNSDGEVNVNYNTLKELLFDYLQNDKKI